MSNDISDRLRESILRQEAILGKLHLHTEQSTYQPQPSSTFTEGGRYEQSHSQLRSNDLATSSLPTPGPAPSSSTPLGPSSTSTWQQNPAAQTTTPLRPLQSTAEHPQASDLYSTTPDRRAFPSSSTTTHSFSTPSSSAFTSSTSPYTSVSTTSKLRPDPVPGLERPSTDYATVRALQAQLHSRELLLSTLQVRAVEGDRARAELQELRSRVSLDLQQHRLREEELAGKVASLTAALENRTDSEKRLRAQLKVCQQERVQADIEYTQTTAETESRLNILSVC